MNSNFMKAFFPSKDDKIKYLEAVISLRETFRGECATCISYIGSDMPGFVTDFGSCKLNAECFYKKAPGFSNSDCPLYEEDVESINKLRNAVDKLKGEVDA